jgi:hypothetical protein
MQSSPECKFSGKSQWLRFKNVADTKMIAAENVVDGAMI